MSPRPRVPSGMSPLLLGAALAASGGGNSRAEPASAHAVVDVARLYRMALERRVTDRTVGHVFRLRDGKVARFDIRDAV